MSTSTFLRILRARWVVVLALFVLSVGITFIATSMLPKQYATTSEVIVSSRSQDPIARGGMGATRQQWPEYLATQVDIIQSPKVAERVVDRLGLVNRPAMRQRYQKTHDRNTGNVDDGDLKTWLVHSVRSHISVTPSQGNMLKIEATGKRPAYVAELANTYAQAYVQTNLDLRTVPAKRYARWYDFQIKKLRQDLENTQNRLATYQQQHDIAVVGEQLDVEIKKLQRLSSMLVDAVGSNLDRQIQLSQIKQGGTPTAELLKDPVIQHLKSSLASARANVSKLSAIFGDNHPNYEQARNEVNTLKRQLSAEVEVVRSNILSNAQMASDRLKENESAVAAQRKKILNLLRQRNKVVLLKQDVTNAQEAYNSTIKEATGNKLESRRTQTDVMILSQAPTPLHASSPKLPLNMVIATALGILLGVGSALLLELFDRRVRGIQDLEDTLGLPVLCTISTTRGLLSRRAVTE